MPGWHWVAGFAGMRAQCGALCGTICGTAAIASGPKTGVTITNRRSLAIERCIVLVKPSSKKASIVQRILQGYAAAQHCGTDVLEHRRIRIFDAGLCYCYLVVSSRANTVDRARPASGSLLCEFIRIHSQQPAWNLSHIFYLARRSAGPD
jgi:hypothetical protein